MLTKDLIHTDPVTLFKKLYQYNKPIKQWVKQNNGNKADAEDVLQDAMIVFYKLIHKPNFELTAKPETLLFSIAKKLWLYQLRQHKNLIFDNHFLDNELIEIDIDFIEQEQKYTQMENVLNLIGNKCLQLLNLFYFEKLDMVEIALKLDFRNDKVAKAMKYKCLEKAKTLITTKP